MACQKCGGLMVPDQCDARCLNCGWREGMPVRHVLAPARGPVALTKKGLLRQRSREDALRGGR